MMTSQNIEVADTKGVIPVTPPPASGKFWIRHCQYFNKYKNFNVCPNEDGDITW